MTALIILIGALPASGATYYVAPTGNDGNNGTSWGLAKATIQAGVDVALTAGDVVLVSNGTYVLSSQVSVPRAITISGFSGNRADVIVDGNGATRCFTVSAAATLANLTIKRGSAASGAGVHLNAVAGIVSNCLLDVNVATGDPAGGGVQMNNAGAQIVDCLFTGNRAASYDGGGILMYAGNVIRSTFITNNCVRWGGAIRMDGGFVGDSTFVSNSANSAPGGVQLRAGSPVVSNSLFLGNFSSGAGAIEVSAGLVFGCTISSNRSSSDSSGGGAAVNGGTLQNCVVSYNRTTGNDAGGAALYSGTIRNCLVFGNYAPRYGGGMRMDGGVLENCTLVGNQSATDHGGIWNRGGFMRNVIIYSNVVNTTHDNYDASMAPFTNSCTFPTPSGSANVTNYPEFERMGSGFGTNHIPGNYRLTKQSLCRDAGTNLGWMATAPDLDGKPRQNGIVDMGAYEFYYASAGILVQFQ